MAFSPKTSRTRNTKKNDDVIGRQKHRQGNRGQHHQHDIANKYVFKCRLKVDNDDADVTNNGKLFHARAAATGKA